MTFRILPALALYVCALTAQAAPSFDCAKARSAVEKAICADPALATADANIARLYGDARKTFDDATAKALTADQRYFVGVRDEAYARPFNKETGAEELAEQMRWRDAFFRALDRAPRKDQAGIWGNLPGLVAIKQDADGTWQHEASAAQPHNARWLCQTKGPLRAEGDTLVFKDPENEGWVLTFKRVGAALVVEETNSGPDSYGPPYCGHNGRLAGTYFPVK